MTQALLGMELDELREALESQSARLFAERATPEQRRELQRQGQEVDALFDELATRHVEAGERRRAFLDERPHEHARPTGRTHLPHSTCGRADPAGQ